MALINKGVEDTREVVEAERSLNSGERGVLRPKTRWNLQKILKFRDPSAPHELSQKIGDYVVSVPGVLHTAILTT